MDNPNNQRNIASQSIDNVPIHIQNNRFMIMLC